MEDFVKKCIENAENSISKLPDEILDMEGMCGNKTRHFYNNLLNMEDARYLEIGTWMGTSLCSAMYGNKANIVCIDNFSQFSGPKEKFLENLVKYSGENKVTFIEENAWNVDVHATFREKINVYVYDGGHEYTDHYNALTHYHPCLDDEFIFVVDDWNWKPTRDGTFDSIKDLGLVVKFKHEIRLTDDDSHTPPWGGGRQTWHNGIGIFILTSAGTLTEEEGSPYHLT
jgi:hypothetical protein